MIVRRTYGRTGALRRLEILWPDPKPAVIEVETSVLDELVDSLNLLLEVGSEIIESGWL